MASITLAVVILSVVLLVEAGGHGGQFEQGGASSRGGFQGQQGSMARGGFGGQQGGMARGGFGGQQMEQGGHGRGQQGRSGLMGDMGGMNSMGRQGSSDNGRYRTNLYNDDDVYGYDANYPNGQALYVNYRNNDARSRRGPEFARSNSISARSRGMDSGMGMQDGLQRQQRMSMGNQQQMGGHPQW